MKYAVRLIGECVAKEVEAGIVGVEGPFLAFRRGGPTTDNTHLIRMFSTHTVESVDLLPEPPAPSITKVHKAAREICLRYAEMLACEHPSKRSDNYGLEQTRCEMLARAAIDALERIDA